MTDVQQDRSALVITVMVSVLLLSSAAVGLIAWRTIYASETPTLIDAAAAQDVVTVVVAVLLLMVATVAVRTGSILATLAWIGLLAFVAYNAAIYCFSVHFGALFLAWTALLGLSVFGAVVTARVVDRSTLSSLLSLLATKIVAWVLIVTAVIFALLWLKEIVPDLLAGRPSTSAAQWRVPTNPVHVLDLALFLPAVMTGGVLIPSRRPSRATTRRAWPGVADPHVPADPADASDGRSARAYAHLGRSASGGSPARGLSRGRRLAAEGGIEPVNGSVASFKSLGGGPWSGSSPNRSGVGAIVLGLTVDPPAANWGLGVQRGPHRRGNGAGDGP